MEKAANLIDYLNQQQTDQPDQNTPSQQPWQDTETQDPPEQEPADVYLAFAGGSLSGDTGFTFHNIKSAPLSSSRRRSFERTRRWCEQSMPWGHTIGLASDGTGDVTEQLTAANESDGRSAVL